MRFWQKKMFLNIIILPLISAILCGLFSRQLGGAGVRVLSIHLMIPTFLLSLIVFWKVGFLKNPFYINMGSWIQCDILNVDWSFLFDSLTVTMLVVVNTVSVLVHIYAANYMGQDPHVSRFMSYLSLFTFFMIILVTGDNFLQLFLGWEGVGLCSYLLINFWYTRIQANKSALKAMILNRFGDYTLMLAIILIFTVFKSLDYSVIFVLAPFFIKKTIIVFNYKFFFIDLICFLLFIGAVGKSAQLGLHTWLPDAMEGPTPVSALIHAATMVTAGIFLIIRCSPLFEYSTKVLSIIVILGVLTSFFAATVGLVQNDIKKIIAYSTCSQLGYMSFVCGFSQYNVSLFHLSNHAFFKALLFLGAGSVIHAMGNEQDIRRMGGLVNFMPVTYIVMLIGSLSLCGFPFLSGFYSKDFILEVSLYVYSLPSFFCYWLGVITALFTAIYSFRLIFIVFLNKTNSYYKVFRYVHESPSQMIFVFVILSVCSIFSGYLTQDVFIGVGSDFFWDSIFILPINSYSIDVEFLPNSYKNIPVIFSLSGILFSYIFHMDFIFNGNIYSFYRFLSNKWYFDFLQNEYIGKTILISAYNTFFKLIDKGFIEILGPTGLIFSFYMLSGNLKKEITGYIYQYFSIVILIFFSMIFFFNS